MGTRRQWVVSVIVALVMAAVVSTVVLRDGGDSCEEWQERYQAALDSMGITSEQLQGGTLQFINMGPLEGLEESQPEGCETP